METLDKKRQIVFLLVGPPGCGKSTWINKYYIWDYDALISRDCIRFNLLKEGDEYFEREQEVRRIFFNEIEKMTAEKSWADKVYIDATHLTRKSRHQVLSHITGNPYVVAVSFEVPVEVALERNAQRSGRALVPENVIYNMYQTFEKPSVKEGFDEVWHIDENDNVIKEHKIYG